MVSNRSSIFLISLLCILLACTGTVSAKEIMVGAGLGNSTITAALANASNGDIITVTDGTYIENVDVMRQVVIRSQNGSAATTIQAQSGSDHVFHIYTDNVNITEFNIKGASDTGKAGIYLHSGMSNIVILNNTLGGNYYGIYFSNADDNNILANNNISNNSELGFYQVASTNNTLTNNTLSSNKYNFRTDGGAVSHYLHNIDSSNEVDGKPIYYWTNMTGGQINSSSNAGVVYLVNCTGVTVKDVEVSDFCAAMLVSTTNSTIENITAANSYYGIYLFSSSNYNYLNGNNAYDDHYGIYLSGSSNNTLVDNEVNDTDYTGIAVCYSSNYNNLTGNSVYDNPYGFYLSSAANNNTLTDNDAHNNSRGFYLSSAANNNNLTGNNASDTIYYGIELQNSHYNRMIGNSVNDSLYGFRLQSSQNNTLTDNHASNTTTSALYLISSPNNSIDNLILADDFPKLSLVSDGSAFIKYATTDSNSFAGKTNVNGYILASSVDSSMSMDIAYDDAGLSSSDEAGISLFRWDGSNWVEAPSPDLDTVNNSVSSTLTEYGTFGLFWGAGSSTPVSTPSGTDDGMSVYRKKQIMEQNGTEGSDQAGTVDEVPDRMINSEGALAGDNENTESEDAYQTTTSFLTTDTSTDSKGTAVAVVSSGIVLVALSFFFLLWRRRKDEEKDE